MSDANIFKEQNIGSMGNSTINFSKTNGKCSCVCPCSNSVNDMELMMYGQFVSLANSF
jgi:hypothetical protein